MVKFALKGLLTLVLLAGLLGAGGYLWVNQALVPDTQFSDALDFKSLQLVVEDVQFAAEDGMLLQGWFFPGKKNAPGILFAHDFNKNRANMLNVILPLQKAGFNCLAWDARAHGASHGKRSTLGIREFEDINAAADYLKSKLGDGAKLGFYGVGMGAHAGVLASAEHEEMNVLVLDGIYPDPAWRLKRELPMLPFSDRLFEASAGISLAANRAADRLPKLYGKDVLFVAPAGDAILANEITKMQKSFPTRKDTESSLVTLSATQGKPLYGGELSSYQQKILAFFTERLS